jgi:hypothetical protein
MTHIPRAERFPIVTRVLWRPRSGSGWSEGVSVNASRSGVLFRAYELPAIGTEVEMIFALSWAASYPLDGADVSCAGRIVRADQRYPGGQAVASTIDSYSFLKQR